VGVALRYPSGLAGMIESSAQVSGQVLTSLPVKDKDPPHTKGHTRLALSGSGVSGPDVGAPAAAAAARAVLTNGHIGHVPRAPDFFLFEGPRTGCGEINFLN